MFFFFYFKILLVIFFSPLEQYDIIVSFGLGLTYFFIPNIVLPLIVLIIIFSLFIFFFRNDLYVLSSFWQHVFETLFIFVLRIIRQQLGSVGYVYFPIIITFFFFIFMCNLLGLTPFSLALTSHISMIAVLTFSINFSIFLVGFLKNQVAFLGLFVPGSPLLLLFLLIPIEIFSYIIRSLSMGIRLAANIIAGHTLVFIISNFLLGILFLKVFFFFFPWALLFAVFFLELGVAFLQAYVFTVLFCIYLNDSVGSLTH